ncbi:MAG: hypothetical protein ACI86C_000609 [Candidatus Latescibacterota bacterium]|jgi:hypothetical protein
MQFNDKGYLQFRNFNQQTKETDTLALEISKLYTQLIPRIGGFNDEVKENSIDNIKLWRDTQPWFPEMLKRGRKRGIYQLSHFYRYKSKVAYYEGTIASHYVRLLTMYNTQAKYLLEKINARLEE